MPKDRQRWLCDANKDTTQTGGFDKGKKRQAVELRCARKKTYCRSVPDIIKTSYKALVRNCKLMDTNGFKGSISITFLSLLELSVVNLLLLNFSKMFKL